MSGSGSVWNNSVNLSVGYTGAGNNLLITNGGSVFCVGGNWHEFSITSNNIAVVTGNGSVWSNADQLNIGNGAHNSLVISDGGKVFATGGGGVGNTFTRGNDNRVLVTGSGSEWNNINTNGSSGQVHIGNSGARNSLVISNSGTVVSWNGEIGGGSVANSNSVLVTGSGSVWTNNNLLWIGYYGSGNSLVISNGGTMSIHSLVPGSGSAVIGYYDTNSKNNSVLITGSGSCWNLLNAALQVGLNGASNTLAIANGGEVSCDYHAYIGYGSGAFSNRIIVSGGNLCLSNRWTGCA